MMKLNRNFAKPILKPDGTPDYAPASIYVTVHHHEEWDEPVVDLETGEPTGETEHKSRDWDERVKRLWPIAEEYLAEGYVPVVDLFPADPAPQGRHYEPRGWEVADGKVRRVYVLVDDPPPPPRTFDPYKLMDELMKRSVWDTVKAWIRASPDGWDRWQRTPDIDEGEPLLKEVLAMAKESFGWSDADVEAILVASVKEGY